MIRPAMTIMQALVKFEELTAELEDYEFKVEVSGNNISLIRDDFMRLYTTVEEFNAGADMLLCVLSGDITIGPVQDEPEAEPEQEAKKP